MFKWLTRNDGKRRAKAVRRLKSPRASVYSEFALVMPLVALICSALIEIVGFWDAQVMANHAAWTVGRIVMVRGSDGLAFSSAIDKKSKTGIPSTNMPEAIKKLIEEINAGLGVVNKFNNRGNIATLFLMSTCGIGYYGASPGKTLSNGLTKIIDAAVKAMTDGIPEWIKDAVAGIKLPSFIPGGESGIAGLVNQIVGAIVDKITEAVLKPIANAIGDLLKSAIEKAIGKEGIKIDDLFNGDGEAARHARQIFGAASRIARAKATIGKEVLVVTDMDTLSGPFMFAKRSALGRLVYPQVADKEAKSDGYFVTGVHGWPANDNGLAMAHVEINWPYESGWLFPAVSGRDAISTKPPVATGHSMVFPQPDIANENLYSEGATAFAPGAYTNNASMAALDELAKEMKNYLKFVKFGMRFRICEESLSFKDGKYHAASVTWWKYIPELKDLWPFNESDGDSYPVGGDYGRCWDAITDGRDQDTKGDTLKDKGYFDGWSYHNRDYYHWDGSYHKSYHSSICDYGGNAALAGWYDRCQYLTYRNSTDNRFDSGNASSMSVGMPFGPVTGVAVSEIGESVSVGPAGAMAMGGSGASYLQLLQAFQRHQVEIIQTIPGGVSFPWLYGQVSAFAQRNKVNVYNLVKWQEGHDLDAWKKQDAEVETKAAAAEKSFGVIKKLIHDEIIDIENMENGTSQWTGDDDDPVFDPNDEEVIKNPDAAAKKAWAKWETMKVNLRNKLKEVDAAAEALRNQWSQYRNDVYAFETDREKCVGEYFAEACIMTLIRTKNKLVFDPSNDSKFKIPAGCMPYDIGKGTREMLDKVKAYQDKLNDSYKKEVEYGAMMGLQSAGKAKKEGKTPDQIVDEAEGVPEDSPGSLAPGSDTGSIIDKDHQEWSGGAWQWK